MIFALIVFILGLIAAFAGPWWGFGVLVFLAALLWRRPVSRPFLSGFAGIALLWLGWALLRTVPNENLLAGKIAALLSVKYWWVLLLITTLVGGLLGGLASLSGSLAGSVFYNGFKKKVADGGR